MQRLSRVFLWSMGAVIGAAASLHADEGMWLFSHPPKAMLKERYGFEPDGAWFERVQKASCRVSTGGSASIVSKNGLVMTNHHVASSVLAQLSTAEEDLLADGFHARSFEQERKCPDLELVRLWQIQDVTAEVAGAVTAGMAPGAANDARQQAINRLVQGAKEAHPDRKIEMVTLYQGGAYHLYHYKSHTDVRLVFAPDKQAAFYGGDVDNFEYPRYCLDVTFFRIYEDDKPLQAEHYLPFSANGAADGEMVMISGHPGSTERGYTAGHVAYLRDVQYPETMRRIWRREVQLQNFSSRNRERRRIAEDDLFSVQNARKLYTGFMGGILDPSLMANKRESERRLKAFVWADDDRRAQWGDAWDEIERACASGAALYDRHTALGRSGLSSYCTLFNVAKDLVRAADERQKPNAERLGEYTDAALTSLEQRLFAPVPIYTEYELERMASWLMLAAEILGADDPTVQMMYAGKGPQARAEELVLGTSMGDMDARRALWDGGVDAIQASKDPMILLVRAMDAENRALRRRWEAEVDGPMATAYAKIAAARFAFEGDSVYPDATFTLRLATGVVKSYEEEGQTIAPFTRFSGLYERAIAREGEALFALDPRWVKRKGALDLTVEYNFVHTCDSTGGNSGSPTINRNGEIVGILFDGNIHSLICDLQYTEVQGRSVSVDSRGIVESLESVYEAGELVRELRNP